MFTKSQTVWLAAALFLGLVMRPTGAPSNAVRTQIDEFFGHWVGVSVIESRLGPNVPVRAEDLDVAIRPQGEGFRVCWTTVRAAEPAGAGPAIRNDWRFVFEPGEARGTWRATETNNTLTTRRGVWANLREQTLTIFGIVTDEGGFTGLQLYDRTLEGEGMSLEFFRNDRDQVLRGLSGRLKRAEVLDAEAADHNDPLDPKGTPAPRAEFCAQA